MSDIDKEKTTAISVTRRARSVLKITSIKSNNAKTDTRYIVNKPRNDSTHLTVPHRDVSIKSIFVKFDRSSVVERACVCEYVRVRYEAVILV